MRKICLCTCYGLSVLLMLSGCATTSPHMHLKSATGHEDALDARLDIDSYIGEHLHVPRTQPAQISRLRLNLIYPEQHKLLQDANPTVAIYAQDGRLLWQQVIQENKVDYTVNQKMSTPVFYVKIGVYYCKQGDQGLCLIQNILYEVPSSNKLPAGPLKLEYQLPGSYF